MTSNPVTYSRIFSKIHSILPGSIENKNLEMLMEIFDSKLSEGAKCFIEAAFRDYLLRKICTEGNANLEHVKTLVLISIQGARKDLCLPTLPVLILSDTYDCITIKQCEELFEFIESNVAIWKEELFFAHCKNHVLRMCNDVLRRLSRSQNTIFCGRILLFLARFFPFSERSGLNLISEFNLENVTVFTDTEVLDVESGDSATTNSEESKHRPSLDYTLYTKFWSLQDFFRSPSQCFQKSHWKLFTRYADDILVAFQSFKLDNVQASKSIDGNQEKMDISRQISVDQEDKYFPKYLTNQKLLDLQFSDSNFRRYILVQMLILSQYLTANIKFKIESLSEEQLGWVKSMQERAFSLLAETPTNGKEFVEIAKAILKREEIWSDWKNNGCVEVKKPGGSLKRKIEEAQQNGKDDQNENEFAQPRKREKRKVGDMIREAHSKGKFVMGNAEMTRLWNICPNNMESCQQSCRDFVPSLESYFSQAIDQVLGKTTVKDDQKLVNDSNFGWRGLRLLASKSPHFFTNSGNSIAALPEYLSNMIKKVAKDLPSQVNEEADEEDKEDEIGVLDHGEGEKDEVEDVEDEEENTREVTKPLEEEERVAVAKALATLEKDQWKAIGLKMGFLKDEIQYFEENGKSVEDIIKTMLDRWVENDDDPSKDNFSFILHALNLQSLTAKILG